jgi:hypothetical protein
MSIRKGTEIFCAGLFIFAGVCAARAQTASGSLSGYVLQAGPPVPLAAAPNYFAPPEGFPVPSRLKAIEKKPNVNPCKVLDFKIILEGWSRPGVIGDSTPCSLVAISTQASCSEGPCYNIACSALMHYSAIVELPPEEELLYPACNFRQEYLGERGYHENGIKRYLQFIPSSRVDFMGSVQWAPGSDLVPVPGFPNRYKADFYDLPGFSPTYFNGTPNATSPDYLPLDWNFMYRAYLGPKYEDYRDEDFIHVKVFMRTGVPPDLSMPGEFRFVTLQEWQDYGRKLQAMNLPTVGE